ncbi:hypothetical protein [Streptomyces sp. NPDC008121]|uniref:hypothetical protein n=1 Tax=Streptomyces sp. NPDC008121 TaxID=3364809 RepID=UPI0036E8CA3D
MTDLVDEAAPLSPPRGHHARAVRSFGVRQAGGQLAARDRVGVREAGGELAAGYRVGAWAAGVLAGGGIR